MSQDAQNEQVNKIKRAVKVAQAAYTGDLTGNESSKAEEARGDLTAEGFEPITIASEFEDETSKNEFRADAYIDPNKKRIVIGISGTRVDQEVDKGKSDLWDDFLLAIGKDPAKLEAARSFIDSIIEAHLAQKIHDFKQSNEGREPTQAALAEIQRTMFDGYEMDFSGHSLGAVLSDCAAAIMYTKLKEMGCDMREVKISSITFDNPGAKTPVKKIAQAAGLQYSELQQAIDSKAFNNRGNLINTLDKQVGTKYRILPDGQKPRNSLSLMFGWLAKRMPGKYLKKTIGFLSFGSITAQIKDHGLDNFEQALVQEEGLVKIKGGYMPLKQAITGLEPIQYDKDLFEKIQDEMLARSPELLPVSRKTKVHKKDKVVFCMTDPATKQEISFSERELNMVYKPILQVVEESSKPKWAAFKRFLNKRHNKKCRAKAKDPLLDKYAHSRHYKQRTAEEVLGVKVKEAGAPAMTSR